MPFDSLVRTKQLNKPEVSGYVVEILLQYLRTGTITGIAMNTGQLTGQFYPLKANPSGYITSTQLSGYATTIQVTGNNTAVLSYVDSNYYPRSNPSGYITSGATSGWMRKTGAAYDVSEIGFNLIDTENGTKFLEYIPDDTFKLKSFDSGAIVDFNPLDLPRPYISGFDIFAERVNGQVPLGSGDIGNMFVTWDYFNSAQNLHFGYINLNTGVYEFRFSPTGYYLLGSRIGFPSENHVIDLYGSLQTTYARETNRPFILGFDIDAYDIKSSGYGVLTTKDLTGLASRADLLTASGELHDADGRILTELLGYVTGTGGLVQFSGAGNVIVTRTGTLFILSGSGGGGNLTDDGTFVRVTGNQRISGNKIFYDAPNIKSLDTTNRILYSTIGGVALNWSVMRLFDTSIGLSLDWNNRVLYSDWGLQSVNWNNGLLISGASGVTTSTVDWTNRKLYGSWNVDSLTFSGRPINTGAYLRTFGTQGYTGTINLVSGTLNISGHAVTTGGPYYPRSSNPSGYVTSTGLRGSSDDFDARFFRKISGISIPGVSNIILSPISSSSVPELGSFRYILQVQGITTGAQGRVVLSENINSGFYDSPGGIDLSLNWGPIFPFGGWNYILTLWSQPYGGGGPTGPFPTGAWSIIDSSWLSRDYSTQVWTSGTSGSSYIGASPNLVTWTGFIVNKITVTGQNLTGNLALAGRGSTTVSVTGNTIIISGASTSSFINETGLLGSSDNFDTLFFRKISGVSLPSVTSTSISSVGGSDVPTIGSYRYILQVQGFVTGDLGRPVYSQKIVSGQYDAPSGLDLSFSWNPILDPRFDFGGSGNYLLSLWSQSYGGGGPAGPFPTGIWAVTPDNSWITIDYSSLIWHSGISGDSLGVSPNFVTWTGFIVDHLNVTGKDLTGRISFTGIGGLNITTSGNVVIFSGGGSTSNTAAGVTGVTGIAVSGNTSLTGLVTFVGGTGITLTQSGQAITISSSAILAAANSYLFSIGISSGIDTLYVPFPTNLGNNPTVIVDLAGTGSGQNIIPVQVAETFSSGFNVSFGANIPDTGFNLTVFCATSTATGLITTIINNVTINTGGFVSTGQTGQFITTAQTGQYAPAGLTGQFVTTAMTGTLAPYGAVVYRTGDQVVQGIKSFSGETYFSGSLTQGTPHVTISALTGNGLSRRMIGLGNTGVQFFGPNGSYFSMRGGIDPANSAADALFTESSVDWQRWYFGTTSRRFYSIDFTNVTYLVGISTLSLGTNTTNGILHFNDTNSICISGWAGTDFHINTAYRIMMNGGTLGVDANPFFNDPNFDSSNQAAVNIIQGGKAGNHGTSTLNLYASGVDLLVLKDYPSLGILAKFNKSGFLGLQTTGISAYLQLGRGQNVPNSGAPLKFTAGTILTTPESGAVEYDGANYWLTVNSGIRGQIITGAGGAGGFVTTAQTGQFAPSGMTGQFITTAQTGQYAPAGLTGQFVTTAMTGKVPELLLNVTGQVLSGNLPVTGISGISVYMSGTFLVFSGMGTPAVGGGAAGGVNNINVSGITISGNVIITGIAGIGVSLSGNAIIISGDSNQTGQFITTAQTGQYAPAGMTGQFITTAQTGQYAPAGLTGQFVNTAMSGKISQLLLNVTGQILSGNIQVTGISGISIYTSGNYLVWSGMGTSVGGGGGGSAGVSSLVVTGTSLTGSITFSGSNGIVVATGAGGTNQIIISGNGPSVNILSGIDWRSGSVFRRTLTFNTTFYFTGYQDAQTIVVALSNLSGSGCTALWPSGVNGVRWPNGVVPNQTSGASGIRTDVYTFISVTGMFYGNAVQNMY